MSALAYEEKGGKMCFDLLLLAACGIFLEVHRTVFAHANLITLPPLSHMLDIPEKQKMKKDGRE